MPEENSIVLDEEGRALQLAAEKAKFRETIARSKDSAAGDPLASVVPTVTDAPKGEVTLGEKAGAFGPWRAHKVVETIAAAVADDVKKALKPGETHRVLVLDDRDLVRKDWTAHQVRATLERLTELLEPVGGDIAAADGALAAAVALYEREEEAEPEEPKHRPGRRDVTEETPAATAGAKTTTPLGAAVDLLALLRTDYTVTASTVTTSPSELAVLTAARLATGATPVSVQADVFTTVGRSARADEFAALLKSRDAVVRALLVLQGRVAPVEAELASVAARLAAEDELWADASADERDGAAHRAAVNELTGRQTQRVKALGPAKALLAFVQQVIAEVDAGVTALNLAPEDGEAPLLTAVRFERLADALELGVTHVLYVNLDALGADAVTRRSILGVSGRIRFLGAGNASWLLVDAAGSVVAGGQVNKADVMTFNLETGAATFAASELAPSTTAADDPLAKLETYAKGLVVAMSLALLAVGAVSLLAIIKVAFP